jgi:hypothetical protein
MSRQLSVSLSDLLVKLAVNPVSPSILSQIASAITTLEPDQLNRELSIKFASINGFYWLMEALSLAAENNNVDAVKAITQQIKQIAEKISADQLAAGLSEKRTQVFTGEVNGFS